MNKPSLKTVLCITEPIGRFFPTAYEMLVSFPFDKVFGCINEYKFPLYLLYFDFHDDIIEQMIMLKILILHQKIFVV
jgi:hypothetical protein